MSALWTKIKRLFVRVLSGWTQSDRLLRSIAEPKDDGPTNGHFPMGHDDKEQTSSVQPTLPATLSCSQSSGPDKRLDGQRGKSSRTATARVEAHASTKCSSRRQGEDRCSVSSTSQRPVVDLLSGGESVKGGTQDEVPEIDEANSSEQSPASSTTEAEVPSGATSDRFTEEAAEAPQGGNTKEQPNDATDNQAPECLSSGSNSPAHKEHSDKSAPERVRRNPRQEKPTKRYQPPAGPHVLLPKHPDAKTPRIKHSPQPSTISVHVLFLRGDGCSVSLLAGRKEDNDPQVRVSSALGDATLLELQDEWYAVNGLGDIGKLLREGVRLRDYDCPEREWLLTGRDIFVLAANSVTRGYVSCPSLTLGRQHVVLCASERLQDVQDALNAAKCVGWSQHASGDGLPTGWQMLRNVEPCRAVPRASDQDILNVLRPEEEIQLECEGGIRLTRNIWLLGHPPTIHMYGVSGNAKTVYIDGKPAHKTDTGAFTAEGWDAAGAHQIQCEGKTKTYCIEVGEANWQFWPAHWIPLLVCGQDQELEICGPIVRRGNNSEGAISPVIVPTSNTLILGSRPGDIHLAHRREDIYGAASLCTAPFAPVWALPPSPLRCHKPSSHVLLINELEQMNDSGTHGRPPEPRDVARWERAILDSCRKGLPIKPECQTAKRLWRDYRDAARRIAQRSA